MLPNGFSGPSRKLLLDPLAGDLDSLLIESTRDHHIQVIRFVSISFRRAFPPVRELGDDQVSCTHVAVAGCANVFGAAFTLDCSTGGDTREHPYKRNNKSMHRVF